MTPAWSLAVITPPAPIVSFEDLKTQLNMPEGDEDLRLEQILEDACGEIEPPNGPGQAFGIQTLEVRFHSAAWTANCQTYLDLPCPPVRSIVSVTYDPHGGGSAETMDEADYSVSNLGSTGIARLWLNEGLTWPRVKYGADAVRVRFTAGYDDGDPRLGRARQAVMMRVGQIRSASRDMSVVQEDVTGVGSIRYGVPSSSGMDFVSVVIDRLLAPYRVIWV